MVPAKPAAPVVTVTLEEFQATYQPPTELVLPEEPLNLLFWQPSETFKQLLKKAAERNPLTVPTAQSYPGIPLTCHYLHQLAHFLHNEFGFSKHALLCLSFVRMLLILPPPSVHDPLVKAGEAILALNQLNTISILYALNLHALAGKVPTALINTQDTHGTITVSSLISDYIKKRQVSADLKAPEPIPDKFNPFGFSTWTPNIDSSTVDARIQFLKV